VGARALAATRRRERHGVLKIALGWQKTRKRLSAAPSGLFEQALMLHDAAHSSSGSVAVSLTVY
jgi:hypothetical protein